MSVLNRRLLQVRRLYLFPLVVFGLVAYCGGWASWNGEARFGVPWLITGLTGVAGTAVIRAAAGYLRAGITHDGVPPARPRRAARATAYARLFMFVAAIPIAVVGVRTAHTGMDRGLSLSVNIGLAVALALFALFANDVGTIASQASQPSQPPASTGPTTGTYSLPA